MAVALPNHRHATAMSITWGRRLALALRELLQDLLEGITLAALAALAALLLLLLLYLLKHLLGYVCYAHDAA
jgi:hypothetical protein